MVHYPDHFILQDSGIYTPVMVRTDLIINNSDAFRGVVHNVRSMRE